MAQTSAAKAARPSTKSPPGSRKSAKQTQPKAAARQSKGGKGSDLLTGIEGHGTPAPSGSPARGKASAGQKGSAPPVAEKSEEARSFPPLPERFRVTSDLAAGQTLIEDRETGRSVGVAMAAYGEVRRLLAAFYGPAEAAAAVASDAAPLTEAPSKAAAPAKASPAPKAAAPAKAAPAPKAAAPAKAPPASKAAAPAKAAPAPKAAAPAKAAPAPKAKAPAKAAPAPAAKAERKPVVGQQEVVAPTSKRKPSKASESASAGPIPEGFEAVREGSGYRLEFQMDPEKQHPGYRILVGGKNVGDVYLEGDKRWVMKREGAKRSIHRTFEGVEFTLEADYEVE